MKKILVVDNHPVLLKFMSNLLEKKGHMVLTSPDGVCALDILKNFKPDIIFVDLVMPNIGGEKLCQIIRGKPDFKKTFIVILSAIAVEEQTPYTDFGADACIAKGPFNKMAEHVLEIIRHSDSNYSRDFQHKIIGQEDIYEREITKELLASKKHYETTLYNLSEGILILTENSVIVYANPAAVQDHRIGLDGDR